MMRSMIAATVPSIFLLLIRATLASVPNTEAYPGMDGVTGMVGSVQPQGVSLTHILTFSEANMMQYYT